MSSAALVVSSRKEYHGCISPAVYSRHAREQLIDDIANLSFPRKTITDLGVLATSPVVKDALSYSKARAKSEAQKNAVYAFTGDPDLSIYGHGYADRHFVPLFAAGIGKDIGGFFGLELSMMDYGKMFQTGWFGDIAQQMALTRLGQYQPALNRSVGSTSGTPLLRRAFGFTGQSYTAEVEPESGLQIVKVTREAKTFLRSQIERQKSVGCPVARTAFAASKAQVEFLEEHGHIGESSGFYVDEQESRESGVVKLSQGAYTAIDDVLWQWGDYVNRYASYLLARGENPTAIEATSADQVILLN